MAQGEGYISMAYESEYQEQQRNGDVDKRKEYWEIAKGLQKVDGLTTSKYLETIIEDTVSGKYDTSIAEQKVSDYYAAIDPDSPQHDTKEPDLVTARIVAYLETDDFKFSPVLLKSIHRDLFQDVLPYKWVGAYRDVNITKEEEVLDGDTVQYANYSNIKEYLEYDFEEERSAKYSVPFSKEHVKRFADFTSKIWQTHPFREGNTRTVSTFLIKYLRYLGVDVNNEPFINNSKFFRDALVRSNYSNLQKGIRPDFSYLNMFFENILQGAENDLGALELAVPIKNTSFDTASKEMREVRREQAYGKGIDSKDLDQ